MPVKAPKPVPEGMNTVTVQLFYKGNCKEAIEFYKKAFNASVVGNIAHAPDGKIMHAMIKIGDTNLMMSDTFSDYTENGGQLTASLFMYVENCDAVYNQAVKAGCTVVHEMTDAFWGDRLGSIRDPFSHFWTIASYKWQLTPEEVAKGQEEWVRSMQS
ncbi:MAG TPA: glyoxalase/bleomycin resistance/extradiol dioxygenase family protein [Bacteroidales bacterium]|nr:glyoxalase/bleomycin resistance/extradiol dioxygenase family protein [Bacteroidales bacterium]